MSVSELEWRENSRRWRSDPGKMDFQEQNMVSWDTVIKSQNDKAEGRSEAPQEDSHGVFPKEIPVKCQGWK